MTRVTATAEDAPPATASAPQRSDRRQAAVDAGLLSPLEPLTRWAWTAVLAVTTLGGLLRFWRLDQPHTLVFDETYYVKQGVSYLRAGYELAWIGEAKDIDPKFAAGDMNVFKDSPDYVVHPPVGKWMIAFGEWIFGPESSWGWRFSVAVVGTLSILMMCLIARRLLGSTVLGVTAGLLFSVDGVQFVMSRTGLLDTFVMFWALAAFGCLLLDREWGRIRLVERIAAGASLDGLGPGLGFRPWRWAAAVCLGLCTGTKWSGIFVAFAFGVLMTCWDAGARRRAGVWNPFGGAVLRDGVLGVLIFVPTIVVVYLASWTGWFVSSGGYDRQWGADNPSRHFGFVPDALRSLWHYHSEMYSFHVGLDTPHPFQSNPWSWMVLGRPTAFYYEWLDFGKGGCTVAGGCGRIINPIGNPLIWWGGLLAVFVLLFRWALSRDWRAGAILCGLAAGYLPWFHYQHRTIFDFYSIAFLPWVVLGLTYALGLVVGPESVSVRRHRYGVIAVGTFVVLAVLVFWFMYPIYTAELIPRTSWSERLWLPGWS
ncbi:dolichyl-phosphate-mannose--protein mannosyltransferase [Spongisporangium articulatum]|uniref:Polyprenol-phosphate-mannose--protein mannosyltransferase n=1 Tax=Spongisporangium articulatum TaxID=3362603 RepID=A0ABW8AQV2_9ACTN